ncbi:MAG: S41 family peptidase [Clostridia bacterium]
MNNRKIWKALPIIMALMLVTVLILGSTRVLGTRDSGRIQAYVDLVTQNHYEYLPVENTFPNMIKGAFDNTDRYTYFQEVRTYRSEMETYIDATYVGIGISMSQLEEGALVENVFIHSPAYHAGLKPGDILVEANGISFRGRTLEYIASKVRGPEDTVVRIGILRDGGGDIIRMDIVRKSITITTVNMFMAGDTAYVSISSFTNNTPEEFVKALLKIDDAKIINIVIDIRDNGGGSVYGALNVANQLLSNEIITKIYYKFPGYLNLAYLADEKEIPYNVVLLMNKKSASASEILAGALKDNGRAVLMGETSFGKSLVQSSYELMTPEVFERYANLYGSRSMLVLNNMLAMNGITLQDHEILGAAKITIGEYVTPKETRINLTGIRPHILVPYDGPTVLRAGIGKALQSLDEYGPGMRDEEIKKAKAILQALGYDSGAPGDHYDGKMEEAVRLFRKDEGLPSGEGLDHAVQAALNLRILPAIIGTDIQLEKAFQQVGEVE